ncbi:MAG: peptidase M20 [SAR86 cluster bacterium]|uniref:Peptidase M20 n=1 Tax=SAR86 cluster bacterium TaxID=2030880 RepID=A0A2A5AYW3_9GAMM|nr:MAG: peptidase M20 [SAR86 cluster bacterium]
MLFIVGLFFVGHLSAQTIEDEAVDWLQEFIQIDTINPPGNESRAVDFYAAIFEAEGIEYETAESAPGRGNIWARIKGGDEPGLILLQHTDVVPADRQYWTTDPLSGEIRDGYIWGRGARDMKGTGIAELATFLSLHRAGLALNRDVVFLASADEEAGGAYGVEWLIENHPEIFAGAGLLINEGGAGSISNGEIVFGVEVTQKVPVWLRLTAVDVPGHGSSPRTTSSVTRIVDALSAIKDNPFPPHVIPAVDAYFSGLSLSMNNEWKEAYADMASAIQDPSFLQEFHSSRPGHHALVRDTCSMTRMGASNKINVIPPEAWAELDCRMLPDRTSEEFIADVRNLIAGTGVEIEVIMAFTPAISSTTSSLYQSITNVTREMHPGSRVLPSVTTGFTDSHFTRDMGIISYGFNPIITKSGDPSGVHGNDERIEIEAFRRGITDLRAIIRDLVLD